MVIAGSDRTTRRRGMRRQRDPSFFRYGPDLRQARESAGLSVESIQDRTGVRRADIEALEQGDLSRFPDEKAALLAVRRVAEILGLDPTPMILSAQEQWPHAAAAPSAVLATTLQPTTSTGTTGTAKSIKLTTSPPEVARPTGTVPAVGGHLSRYPGDTSHLKAFTQTAQVPQVGRGPVAPSLPPGLRFDTTDAVPVTWSGPHQPDPAPLALRVAVWSAVLLLTLGVAGVAVHHYRPAWLAKLHLVPSASAPPVTRTGTTGPHTTVPPAPVTQTSGGPQAAAVDVRAAAYTVVVTTQAPCWINVTSPASFAPVFSATVPGGTTKTFAAVNGQLTVELGASHAVVTAQIGGRTVPHWSLTPGTAPFVLTFHSVTS